MAIELNTKVSMGETFGKKIGNLILEDAKFFGRPNFAGDAEKDPFKDPRQKFTVLIPNDVADTLREVGWNVKTTIPTPEDLEKFPDREPVSHLKVFLNFRIPEEKRGMVDEMDYEKGPECRIIQGETQELLNSKTVSMLDRAFIETLDLEIRAWEYNPEEHPGQYSARLEALVAVMRPSRLDEKYGRAPR